METKKWSVATDSNYSITGPSIGADGTIYVGSDKGLYAINPEGTQKWVVNSECDGGGLEGDLPIAADDVIYCIMLWPLCDQHKLIRLGRFTLAHVSA